MLHVCIDDASRLAYTEILPDEKKQSAIAFLDRALAWFGRLGVAVERIMTDNGSAYRSHDFRQRIAAAGLKHIRTRPYTPRTNGKVERFIQTSLREWAYARPYHSSAERTHAMPPWITDYNLSRPHSALRHLTRRSTEQRAWLPQLGEGLLCPRPGRKPDQGAQAAPRLRPHLLPQGDRQPVPPLDHTAAYWLMLSLRSLAPRTSFWRAAPSSTPSASA